MLGVVTGRAVEGDGQMERAGVADMTINASLEPCAGQFLGLGRPGGLISDFATASLESPQRFSTSAYDPSLMIWSIAAAYASTRPLPFFVVAAILPWTCEPPPTGCR